MSGPVHAFSRIGSRGDGDADRRADVAVARQLPYTALVEERVLRTAHGDYLQAFRLGGASFECTADADLNRWHERLAMLWRNIASPQVALWTHVIRRRERRYPGGRFAPGFAADLNERYRTRLAGETLWVNELYVSVLYRPQAGAAGQVSRWWGDLDPAVARREQAEALEACTKLAQALAPALAPYEPEPLGVVAGSSPPRSALLEFLALLVNAEAQPLPLVRGPVREALATTRLLFGHETIEYRLPDATRFGAMLGIKEYPPASAPGMLNRLLSVEFPFVLTQSFTFIAKGTAQRLLQQQAQRLANAGDAAVGQASDLQRALEQVAGNELVLGDHHFTLQVLTEPVPAVRGSADAPESTEALRLLGQHLAEARTLLAETGMVVAREDLALEAGFWAQLPGHFAYRARRVPLTSRNFAALAPFHNFPTGRPDGHHWGEALALFATTARSPFYFSLHASAAGPREARPFAGIGAGGGGSGSGAARDTGHTMILGPTGSGKTVLLGFLVAMLTRQGVTQVVFDKDRGLEILVRALGGAYRPLRIGAPSGMNPLALEPTGENTEFLRRWLRRLVERPERPLTVREEADLDAALTGTLALAPEARRLSRLLEFLDATDPQGVRARLAAWCESAGGSEAWVFDNALDTMAAMVSGQGPEEEKATEETRERGLGSSRSALTGSESTATPRLVAFDVTDFLASAVLRGPVSMYLFHLVRRLLDGRRLVVWMDEFSRLLDDPAFEGFAKDGLKTWRKLNAVAAFATQSASDVLGSPIARTLIEQTPTQIFFPNPQADRREYCEGFGLSEREWRLLRDELAPASRAFLVRQAGQSVVCRLDLEGFDFELDVISGRLANVVAVERLIAACGPRPEDWLPRFREERARRR